MTMETTLLLQAHLSCVCPNHPDSTLRIIKYVRMCIETRYYGTENTKSALQGPIS
jgi:hypothetical protein